jgi:two-component system, OmpR family, sensor histidine kinase KdpD
VRSHPRTGDLVPLAAGLGSIGAAIVAFRLWLDVSNPTIAALTFLLVVLIVASTSRLWVAVCTAVAAMLAFNFYFLPPVDTLTIADPQNWVALFVFLAVSLIASNLSAAVRARAHEAQSRRDELTRLFDLSRDILVITEGHHALPGLARSIANRFDIDYVAIALPKADDWDIFEAGALELALGRDVLSETFARITGTLEFDARARTYSGHAMRSVAGQTVRLVPLRVGTRPIGLLAAAGRPIEPGTLDVLAGIVAIAIERTRFLDERKAAELTRQSEELKSALLASLGHDLRTPLTAIRVAASNLEDTWLGEAGRRDQADIILTEVERLTRLFQNILSMAKIDAGPIATAVEWAVPSDILAAAREQVEHAVRRHSVDATISSDSPVRLDPKLTATALAHVLENAAQYSPPGATIRVAMSVEDGALRVSVRDHGPGISAADLPRLFDRFFRGDAARTRGSGTGMGLAIARGLLAAEAGRIWAENDPDGGAIFTITVPVEQKAAVAIL